MTTSINLASSAETTLPAWSRVLAVVAHPDDESFGLGAVLDAFVRGGTVVSVLALTHGEASTVHGVSGDLTTLRGVELSNAATALGVSSAKLLDHPDGHLASDAADVVAEVTREARRQGVTGLVVFDPSGVTGHPDHVAATEAALAAATDLDIPVLGWTLPTRVAELLNAEFSTAFIGHDDGIIDIALPVDRERQRLASLAHASQAVPTSVLWRRLELLGDVEHLRWLRRRPPATPVTDNTSPEPAALTMRVDYQGGDRFAIAVRDHVVVVDQPRDVGGDDLGPTPTELFVASLVSCVAFYARRYLHRHGIDATGLAVESSYRMGTRPARVAGVDITVIVPHDLSPTRREGLLRQVGHCTVHNSIVTPPELQIHLA